MPVGSYLPHRIRVWSGSAWVVRADLEAPSCSEGASNCIGQAVIRQRYGFQRLPGVAGSTAVAAFDTSLRSQYVNVQLSDGVGGWNDLWYGYINGEERIDRGARDGEAAHHAVGIVNLLARCRCLTGRDYDGVAAPHGRAGYLPPFNLCPKGDRSAATVAARWSAGIYIHDRTTQGTKWTARQILDSILVTQTGYFDQATQSWAGTMKWQISDPDGCLDYTPPAFDAGGMSVLDVVNSLASSRRGLAWRATFAPATWTVTITVRSTTPTSFATGVYTLPASSLQTAVDLRGLWQGEVRLTWNEDATADIIDVAGAQPWSTITLVYDSTLSGSMPSLVNGWTSGDATDWNALAVGATKAWCRFACPQAWDGQQYNDASSGLGNALTASGSTDPLHGEGGLTGARTYTAATTAVAGTTLTLTRDLPAGLGWKVDPIGTREQAGAWMYNGTAWVDLTPLASGAEVWQLDVETTPGQAAIHLGSAYDDQFRVSQWLQTTGAKLLVTVGVRESAPLRVSWRRPAAQWPRTEPRVMSVSLPQYELWRILKGTIKGLASGSPSVQGADAVVRDDTPHLKAALGLLRAFYANAVRSLVFPAIGSIDVSAGLAPGALITTATFDSGTETVNAVVTRRTWNLTEDAFGTVIECEPLPPDLEVIR